MEPSNPVSRRIPMRRRIWLKSMREVASASAVSNCVDTSDDLPSSLAEEIWLSVLTSELLEMVDRELDVVQQEQFYALRDSESDMGLAISFVAYWTNQSDEYVKARLARGSLSMVQEILNDLERR